MIIKFNKEISLTPNDVKDIIIKHLHSNHNLSGIFDVNFLVRLDIDCLIFDGAEIKVSTNEI